ncbi:hypothetical protein FB446DRAFT_846559 [Lentinula raphanica]|nr:hypothetical protein FB446DRAFT_846559 [Lentinula raphanica]
MTSFPCPLLTSTQVLVDDADSRILYSPAWKLGGTPGFECDSTTHISNFTVISTATLTFVGIHVEVFGTTSSSQQGLTSTYQVDDLPISTYTFPVNVNSQTNYRVPFYLSPLLELGNHTLTIVVPPGDDADQLYLDYIIYDSGPASTLSSSSVSPIPSPTLTISSSPSTPLSSSALPTGHSFSSIDVIASGVGGSLGGLTVGLSALALIILRSNWFKLGFKGLFRNAWITITSRNATSDAPMTSNDSLAVVQLGEVALPPPYSQVHSDLVSQI